VLLAPHAPPQLVLPVITEPKRGLVFRVVPPPRPATKHALAEANDIATTADGDLTATISLKGGPDGAATSHNVILRHGAKSIGSRWRRKQAARAALVAAFVKPKKPDSGSDETP
jgi:hypothetical protein